MFGKNPIEKQVLDAGRILHLVAGSPFLTIQGEGPYRGEPAVFIRLHGCNLACTFCDTQFSDPCDPIWQVVSLVEAVRRIRGAASLAVITGGEPMRQNIIPLCEELHMIGMTIQVETAGTLWLPGLPEYVQLVVSPKTPHINAEVSQRAIAFKYIINADDDIAPHDLCGFVPITATQARARKAPLAGPLRRTPVYLSPMDCYDPELNKRNIRRTVELALRFGHNAGLQLHKFMGVD